MDPHNTSDQATIQDDVVELESGDDTTALPDGTDMPELEAPEELELTPGEELPGEVDPAPSITPGDPASLIALQGVINRQSSRLDELRNQIKQVNESLRSILENDSELAQAEEELKQVTKRQKDRKTTLSNSAESMQLKNKLKEVREQIKDLEESLNNHLLNYYDITKVKVIDTADGGQREFTVKAKLLSKKQS